MRARRRETYAMRVAVLEHGTRRRRERRRRAWWTGGELLVTAGLVLLLLVVHQLWWTNREARQGAQRKVEALEREWGRGAGADSGTAAPAGSPSVSSSSSSPAPGERSVRVTVPDATVANPAGSQSYAVLTIPRLHLRVPVAEGVDRQSVLDKGYAGHYRNTQQPGQAGNFALAGHRNTHGEPFRYINRLVPKDTVQVETEAAVYTYVVDRVLRQTSARDSGVIGRIPRSTVHPAYGYTSPGYYITLTTCTPEYTSRYRLVVWGELVSMRPR